MPSAPAQPKYKTFCLVLIIQICGDEYLYTSSYYVFQYVIFAYHLKVLINIRKFNLWHMICKHTASEGKKQA